MNTISNSVSIPPSDTSRPPMPPSCTGTAQAPAAALSDLAANLGSHDFITVLTSGQDRIPRLAIAHRHLRSAEDVYACGGWYWWAWAERIAPTTDPATAAHKVASRLRAAPGPAGG